jgi:hypothetical protein
MTHPNARRLNRKVAKAEPPQSPVVPDATESAALSEDLLIGAAAIAVFMFGNEHERRRVYWMAGSGQLPVFRLGSTLCARKSSLLRSVEARERAAVSDITADVESAESNEGPP